VNLADTGSSFSGVLLFLAGFVALWLFVLNLLSLLGGWRWLANSYAAIDRPAGESFAFRSGSFGFVNYGSCLRFISCPTGLYIAVLAPFRPGHRPLFVPWPDVRVKQTRGLILRYAEFHFARQPRVRVRVLPGLARKLLAAGGNVVHLERAA
jgi:hypothetical protein